MSQTEELEAVDPPAVSTIVLPPDCGLNEVEAFLDTVLDEGNSSFDIDASGVEKMSATCALAVVSLLRHAEEGAGKVALINPASIFVDAFTELGLFQDLMKMEFRQ